MHPSPARLPSRRAVLGLGVVGTGLMLGGCGLRLDVPPAVPEPDALDSLRNDVARILSATEPPAAGSAELDELRAAVGPVWAPPTELVTPTATPTPVSFDFADGTAAAVERFAEGLPAVVGDPADPAAAADGRELAALADVAVGCVLALGTADAGRAAELGGRLGALPAHAPDPAGPDAGGGATAPPSTTGGDGDGAEPGALGLEAFIRACYQAAYGYERLAVFHDADSDYGAFARDRIGRLDDAAIQANELLETAGGSAVTNAPAWQVEPVPEDAETALVTARALEDLVAGAVLGLFDTPGAAFLAAAQLWFTGDARARTGERQLLRYAIRDAATASPNAEGGA